MSISTEAKAAWFDRMMDTVCACQKDIAEADTIEERDGVRERFFNDACRVRIAVELDQAPKNRAAPGDTADSFELVEMRMRALGLALKYRRIAIEHDRTCASEDVYQIAENFFNFALKG